MPFFVCMLASRKHGTLYVGVTNDLARRVSQHKHKALGGFTARHDVDRLVWTEGFDDPADAIRREKAVKRWRWAWRIEAIEKANRGVAGSLRGSDGVSRRRAVAAAPSSDARDLSPRSSRP